MYSVKVAMVSIVAAVATVLAPARADTVTRMLLSVNDEREQEFGGNHDPGLVRAGSSDLELGMERAEGYGDDPGEVDAPQRVALRYQNIDIPPGAVITSAHLQFMTDDEPDKTTWFPFNDPELGELMPLEASVSLYGFLHPNSPELPGNTVCDPFGNCINEWGLTNLTGGEDAEFTGVGSDIENVTAPVHWEDIPTWTTGPPDYFPIAGTAGPDQQSPDLASIVQEIIDLPEWTANNAMTFFIDPMVTGQDEETGADIFARGNRTAVAFNCGPSPNRCVDFPTEPQAPVLTIEFTTDVGLAGDFNGDGTVNAIDYAVWRDGLGDAFAAEDYDTWKSQYGMSLSVGSAHGTVPEPGALLLWMSATALALLCKSRCRTTNQSALGYRAEAL